MRRGPHGPRHRPGDGRGRPQRRALRTRSGPRRSRPSADRFRTFNALSQRRRSPTRRARTSSVASRWQDLAEAAAGAELIIEAVFEDEAVKQELFKTLDSAAPAAPSASNTSSISITSLAAAVGESRRHRFVGMHFFSPVPVMPLIEMIRGDETDDATEAYVRDLAAELGKQVIVSRDRPGFIVNRVLMPFLVEGCAPTKRALPRRRTSTPGPDRLNHPMGPLELADFIGLDVCLNIMKCCTRASARTILQPRPCFARLVDDGHLGQKTGRGFYAYPREQTAASISSFRIWTDVSCVSERPVQVARHSLPPNTFSSMKPMPRTRASSSAKSIAARPYPRPATRDELRRRRRKESAVRRSRARPTTAGRRQRLPTRLHGSRVPVSRGPAAGRSNIGLRFLLAASWVCPPCTSMPSA